MVSGFARSLLLLLLSLASPADAFRAAAPRAAARRPPATALATLPLMMADEKPSSVTKQALVDAIAAKAGVSKKTAQLVLGATLDVIVDSVAQGHKVQDSLYALLLGGF